MRFVLFLLVLVCIGVGEGSKVKQMIRDYPDRDVYEYLDVDDLEEWSFDYDLSLGHRLLQLLEPLEEVVQIQVILVGFDDIRITSVCYFVI